MSLYWASSIQSMTPHPTSKDPSQYYPPIYAWVSQAVSPPKLYTPLFSPIRTTCGRVLVFLWPSARISVAECSYFCDRLLVFLWPSARISVPLPFKTFILRLVPLCCKSYGFASNRKWGRKRRSLLRHASVSFVCLFSLYWYKFWV